MQQNRFDTPIDRAFFRLFTSLAFFRNESGLIKRTLPVLAARKMAGGHSSRSWTARRNLILEKGVIYRRTVSNHRGGRKKSYLMEKILCPTVLRANNWRTPRKVAYIALLSRGANCNNKIRSFLSLKKLGTNESILRTSSFFKKVDVCRSSVYRWDTALLVKIVAYFFFSFLLLGHLWPIRRRYDMYNSCEHGFSLFRSSKLYIWFDLSIHFVI